MIRVGCRGYANSGTFIDDKYFVQNITNAKKAGVKVGAYFYSQAIKRSKPCSEFDFKIRV